MPMVIVAVPSSALAKTGKLNLVTGVAMFLTAGGLLWLGFIMGPEATWKISISPLVLTGIGTGIAMPHMMNLALEVVPASRAGAATGAANTALPLGTGIGVAVFGALMSSQADLLSWASPQERAAASEGKIDELSSALNAGQLREVLETFTSGLSLILFVSAALSAICAISFITVIRRNTDRAEPTKQSSVTLK